MKYFAKLILIIGSIFGVLGLIVGVSVIGSINVFRPLTVQQEEICLGDDCDNYQLLLKGKEEVCQYIVGGSAQKTKDDKCWLESEDIPFSKRVTAKFDSMKSELSMLSTSFDELQRIQEQTRKEKEDLQATLEEVFPSKLMCEDGGVYLYEDEQVNESKISLARPEIYDYNHCGFCFPEGTATSLFNYAENVRIRVENLNDVFIDCGPQLGLKEGQTEKEYRCDGCDSTMEVEYNNNRYYDPCEDEFTDRVVTKTNKTITLDGEVDVPDSLPLNKKVEMLKFMQEKGCYVFKTTPHGYISCNAANGECRVIQ